MSSSQRISVPRAPEAVPGWKIACGIGAAIVFAPVLGMALVFLLATVLPLIPLMLPMLVGFLQSSGPHAPTASPGMPSLMPRPQGSYRLAHGAA